MKSGSIILVLLCLLPIDISAQRPQETGVPFMKYYSPQEFGGQAQTWGFVRDKQGLLYIANGAGIITWDGVRWQSIHLSTASQTMAMSLAYDPEADRVYVGGFSTFGYLRPDAAGRLVYQPLEDRLLTHERSFKPVYHTAVAQGLVFYIVQGRVFIWDGRDLHTRYFEKGNSASAWQMNGTLWIVDHGLGLRQWRQGEFVPVPGGEVFAGREWTSIQIIRPGRYLCLAYDGIFVFENGQLSPLNSPVNTYLREAIGYKCVTLADSTFAVATIKEGLFVINDKGDILLHLNVANGLPMETVLGLYADPENLLWMGLGNGFVRVEYPGPFSWLGRDRGLFGTINQIVRFKDRLMLPTQEGVSYLVPHPEGGMARVAALPYNLADVFGMYKAGNQLYIGENTGAYTYDGTRLINLFSGSVFCFTRSRQDTAVMYAGNTEGVVRFVPGKEATQLPGISAEVRSLMEDDQGYLWVGTLNAGIMRLDLRQGVEQMQIKRFTQAHGLAAMRDCEVFADEKGIIFATPNQLLRYDPAADRLVPDTTFGTDYTDGSRWVWRLGMAPNGTWICAYEPHEITWAVRNPDGRYALHRSPFQRLNAFPVYAVLAEGDSVTWFGGPEGLVRYDARRVLPAGTFQVAIRQVTAGADSVLFAGAGTGAPAPVLSYAYNSIRFDNAALSLENPADNQYRYRLLGYESSWSAWTPEPFRIYTNLSAGAYTFEVQAINRYGVESPVARYVVTVMPPWYREPWFLLVVSLAGIGLGIWVVRYFATRRLIRRVAELELQQEVQRERERISRDLHDNVGAHLTHMITHLDVIAHKGRKESFAYVEERLENVSRHARETMQQLRETIWAINRESLTPEEFAEKVREYLRQSLDPQDHLQGEVLIAGAAGATLSPGQALNAFRIVQEAIQNVVKHAGATRLTVRLEAHDARHLVIEVRDNGAGMTEPAGQHQHYGLQNMQARAREIQADLTFESSPGQGLCVRLRI